MPDHVFDTASKLSSSEGFRRWCFTFGIHHFLSLPVFKIKRQVFRMQATEAYRKVEIQLHTFLTVAWSHYCPSTLTI